MKNPSFNEANADYYTVHKTWLLPHIKEGPNRVMDLGCASGWLGTKLLETGKASEVTGVEIFDAAAREARKFYKEVHVGDIEEMPLDFDECFDYVICGDILEHLKDPYDMVRRIFRWLKPGGSILACVPNVRNYRLLRDLIFLGKWEYVSAGVLDQTHLRFFTRKSCRQMLEEAGFQIYHQSMVIYGPKKNLLNRLTFGFFNEFLALQTFCCCVKPLSKKDSSEHVAGKVVIGGQNEKESSTTGGEEPTVFVSVIMPCYNQRKFVAESIAGVLSQTWRNLELIIVDDASIDGSSKIIETFAKQDPRVRTITHEKTLGSARSRNDGISVARGEFLAFCDSDDVWNPERLAIGMNALRAHPDKALLYSNASIINEAGEPTGHNFSKLHRLSAKHTGYLFNELCTQNFINTASVLMRKSCLGNSAPFDEDIQCVEDWWCWINLAAKHQFLYLDCTLSKYRINSLGLTLSNPRRRDINRFKVSRRLLKRYPEMPAWLKSEILYYAATDLVRIGRKRSARVVVWMAVYQCIWNWRALLRLVVMPGTKPDALFRRLLKLKANAKFLPREKTPPSAPKIEKLPSTAPEKV